MSDRIGEGHKK
ncbi:Protein of unknown function [Bacillus toyonensis]|nr:Protein of unknown function [Bacillus toyonensis]